MRTVAVALLVLAVAAYVAADAGAADSEVSVDLGERDDGSIKRWDRVMGAAAKKPVFVLFYSPRCAHSRGFLPEFEAAAADMHSDVTFAKVDIDRWDLLKAKFDVTRVPDIRFCSVGQTECQPYPERAPNTHAGVVAYLSDRTGAAARFAAADADVELSAEQAAAIAATKGTCAVSESAGAAAEDADVIADDEEGDAAESDEFDAESFVELQDEDEDEAEDEAADEAEDEADAEDEIEADAEDAEEVDA